MFDNKHVFVISAEDYFFYLNIDALINKAGVERGGISVLVFDCTDEKLYSIKKIEGISYSVINGKSLSALQRAQTVTFMSIDAKNALYIKQTLDLHQEMLSKVYIFLTDDEIDRWNKCCTKYGKIKVSKSPKVCANEVEVLKKVRGFVGHAKTFETKTKKILKRDDIQFIDAGVIFDTLPTYITKSLDYAIIQGSSWEKKEKKILIGTKQKSFSMKEIIATLSSLCRFKAGEEYKIMLMWHKKHRKQRVLIDLYLMWLRHTKRQTIDISYVTALSPVAYTALIASCSHIVLQRRGGASTVRSYLKLGKGILCVPADSANEFGFKDALGLDIVSFHSSDELVLGILNSKIDIRLNAEKTIAEENRSIKVLKQMYL